MRVRIDIGLDLDGIHSFAFQPSDAPGAIDVPSSTLERWSAERESFHVACLRWKLVCSEIEEALLRAEAGRATPSAAAEPAQALAAAVARVKARNRG